MRLSQAALKSSLERTFTQACPEITTVLSAGHPELRGEQTLHLLRAPISVSPLVFYARAVALTWEDYMTHQGRPWPGRQILTPDDLQLPGFVEIEEDLLCGEFVSTKPQSVAAWVHNKAGEAGASLVLEPVQEAWQVLDLWNQRRWLLRSANAWVLVEWGTSA